MTFTGLTLDAVRWLDHHRISVYLGDVGDAPPRSSPTPAGPGRCTRSGWPASASPWSTTPPSTTSPGTSRTLERASFLLVLAPPSIHGATGVPVNPLAVF